MKISNITFGKKIISQIPIKNLNNGQKENMSFVSYGDKPYSDSDHIYKYKKIWENNVDLSYSFYACEIANNVKSNPGYYEFYGIEDKYGEIQAICEIKKYSTNAAHNVIEIAHIATNPENAYFSDNRTYSGLGTSLFKKIVEIAQSRKASKISLLDASDGFWEKMPCLERESSGDYSYFFELSRSNYDACLEGLDEILNKKGS